MYSLCFKCGLKTYKFFLEYVKEFCEILFVQGDHAKTLDAVVTLS